MDKRSKIALYIIGAVIVFIMIAEIVKPQPLNWRDSFSAADKIPLGCYVLFNELETFTDEEVIASEESIYQYLKKVDHTSPKTLMFINNRIYFDSEESNALIDFVEQGNTVFISSIYHYGNVLDSLNVSVERQYANIYRKEAENKFTSPSLKANNRIFKDVVENSHFVSVDSLNTTILGTITTKTEDDNDNFETNPNLIKIDYGDNDGQFILHTNPFAFTNYHLLNDKEDYAATVLSYLPKQQIIWDNNYKSGRKVITSPLRYILENQALKWAFYISMFGLILFVIFRGKRTQRIIPVINKLDNATVDFTRTIGELYYQHGDFTNIIEKKIQYFLEFVRTKYYLDTNQLNPSFIEKLAVKSSNTKEDAKTLVDYLVFLKSKKQHTEQELIELNKKIEHFTKHKL
ncbi:DUF4350 domain-containing protein [Winogradskyella echinorum]|uniref:DUF4350 domain-containing protein n=1 Tax=Winogradskyella echinorum TaxID=538189 RepID=A0ABR6Y3P2_9FLAO|nr:DUF4350 domain-containing protein [Winogradskyella echinorum]MBC3846858.1 DUF4350 domain-containing protein [Winogradskyella echinorum]MBC5751206.1 DUF4350 domain-containing protein [Winogradskyella echinorum]